MTFDGKRQPPEVLFDATEGEQFIPAPELIRWARATFIAESAPQQNEEHVHRTG